MMGSPDIGVIGKRWQGLPENYPHGQHESARGVCTSSSDQTDSTASSDPSAATSTQHHATPSIVGTPQAPAAGQRDARQHAPSMRSHWPIAGATSRHGLLDQRLARGELMVEQRETLGDALPTPVGCATTNSSRRRR
jgi:hypothetical protein